MHNTSVNLFRLTLCALLVVAGVCAVAVADPPTVEVHGQTMDSRTRRVWAGNYRKFAAQCAAFEDGFAMIHDYDRRIPSSRGLTIHQAVDELTVTWRETRNGIRRNYQRKPQDQEAHAYATALNRLRQGDYGHIDSAEVVAVLGPDEMLVTKLWLIDKDEVMEAYRNDEQRARAAGNRNPRNALNERYKHRLELIERQEEDAFGEVFRIVGYATRGLLEGQRWDGPRGEGFQVGVIKSEYPAAQEAEAGNRRPNNEKRLVLADLSQMMRQTLDEGAFVGLLSARGYTIVEFVTMLRELRAVDREGGDRAMLDLLMPPVPQPPEEEQADTPDEGEDQG